MRRGFQAKSTIRRGALATGGCKTGRQGPEESLAIFWVLWGYAFTTTWFKSF